jgi:hypothetical protein
MEKTEPEASMASTVARLPQGLEGVTLGEFGDGFGDVCSTAPIRFLLLRFRNRARASDARETLSSAPRPRSHHSIGAANFPNACCDLKLQGSISC